MKMFCRIFKFYNKKVIYVIQNAMFSKTPIVYKKGENVKEALFNEVSKCIGPRRKVTIFGGSGKVSTAAVYSMMRRDICDEIVILDTPKQKDRLESEALDLEHCTCFYPSPKLTVETNENYCASENSDIIVIAAGQRRKPNDSRMKIAQNNVNIMKTAIPKLAKLSPDTIFIVATAPVDIISYAVWKYSGFQKNRVLGTGTSIDLMRLKSYIAQNLGIHPASVGASIIAEHGDVALPLWSNLHLEGTNLRVFNPCLGKQDDWQRMYCGVANTGNELNTNVGYGCFTLGSIISRLIEDILEDKQTIHHVSIQVQGLYNICPCIFISLPAVIGNRGVVKIVKQCLDKDETSALYYAAEIISKQQKTIRF